MVEMKVTTRLEVQKVLKIKSRRAYDTLGRAGAYTRAVMRNTIRSNKKARPGGKPMTSPTKLARSSIVFSVNEKDESVQIGPKYSILGRIGSVHEFGGMFRGRKYPARPFAAPTIPKVQPKLAEFWRGTVTE